VTESPLPVVEGRDPDVTRRDQLSSLQALLVLAMVMTETTDEQKIIQLAGSSVPSLGHVQFRGVHVLGAWEQTSGPLDLPDVRGEVEVQFAVLSSAGGALAIRDEPWGWAYPLRSLDGHFGYMMVSGDAVPDAHEQFVLRVLAQQTGIALANAQVHARERAIAVELRSANTSLALTVDALERSTAIHDRLTRVAVAGEGREGIAQAVHELTGYAVAVEDRHGNLRAWAGPRPTEPHVKESSNAREQLLRKAIERGQPMRHQGRLLVVARPSEDVIGVLALSDPDGTAGEQAQTALEHGATVLAMELARLQSLAEAELRLRRDLTEELLSGTDEESALARGQALGYDLERPHRVVVVLDGEANNQHRDELFQAVRRTARDQQAGTLLVARAGGVVLLSDADVPWERFRVAVLAQLGRGRCRLGVGGVCEKAVDFPRSYREARFAMTMRGTAGGGDQASAFDDLGMFRILAGVEDVSGLERFVLTWLAALLKYDTDKKADLVSTLCVYLECGGNYNQTSNALSVHRSTLKYRLQRIREISGHDLSNPDTAFNLQLACRAWQTLTALRSF
jgi:sugar diacid utilization regulator